MKRIRGQLDVLTVAAALAALLAVPLAGTPASAQITVGALSNFDVFNDTGQDCHGFEIELRHISSSDVYYTFGMPFNRYGDPKVVPFTDASGSGVYIRYESRYDLAAGQFVQRTAPAPSPVAATRPLLLQRRLRRQLRHQRLRALRRLAVEEPHAHGVPVARRRPERARGAPAVGDQGQHPGADLERRPAGRSRRPAGGAPTPPISSCAGERPSPFTSANTRLTEPREIGRTVTG